MERFVNLLNYLGVGVVATNRSGGVQLWNQCMEEWTGLVPEVMLGRSIGACFPQLKAISECKILRHPYSTSASFNPPPIQASHPLPPKHNIVTEFQLTVRDLAPTMGNSSEEESSDHTSAHTDGENNETIVQTGDRGDDLASAVGGRSSTGLPPDSAADWYRIWTFQPRQQQLEQAHTDFVATVSHELRTPLTSIKGFVDTMLQCHGQLSSEQQQKFLKIVKDQADRLIHMVEDVLLVSHLQSGQLHNSAQQLALPESFQRVLSGFPTEEQERVQLNFLPGLPTVWADPDRLDQILRNLLDNALTFSESETNVLVEARLHKEDPNRVSITIRDFGCGMTSEQLAQLFRRFNPTQNPLTRGDRAGTGLGLYITKSLVESFGGRIRIDSEVNRGTTCRIDLPSAPDIRWTPPEPLERNSEPVPEWANSLL